MEILSSVEDKCEICLKYKKSKLRPVVVFSLSRDFNDVIAIDLKAMNVNILHIIDHIMRFSAAAVIKSKRKEHCWRID